MLISDKVELIAKQTEEEGPVEQGIEEAQLKDVANEQPLGEAEVMQLEPSQPTREEQVMPNIEIEELTEQVGQLIKKIDSEEQLKQGAEEEKTAEDPI